MDVMDTPEVQDLPDQIAIMVVDTKGFSQHNDRQQNVLAPLIPQVLRRACDSAGIQELWQQKCFPDSTGDGFIIGFPPALLPRVVHNYLEFLQMELRAAARTLPTGTSLRMRLSLNIGPVALLNDVLLGSPVGATMIDAHRMVDVPALRVLLDRSDPEVTFLVAALSERVVQDTVRSGYANRRMSEFVATPVAIKSKDFTGTAYLRVPAPSGDLLAYGLLGVQPPPEGGELAASKPEPQPTGDHLVASTGGRLSQVGDLGDGSVASGDIGGSVGVVGPVSGQGHTIAGRDLDQSTNLSTTGRDSYSAEGDMNFGARSGQ